MSSSQTPHYRPLEGKIALITGASRGIGAAIAQNLAAKGATLILNYTSPSSADVCSALATALSAQHDITTHVIQADLSTPTGPAELIATAKSQQPSLKLDIIVNNAGVSKTSEIADCTVDDFHYHYSVNVLAPLLLMKAALPYLPNDRSGRIINVSSVSSSEGFIGQSVYGGTKAALEAMTRTWARELAGRATVNAINPGPVRTDMWAGTTTKLKSFLKPWMQKTPLAVVREDIDDADLVAGAATAGGRPAYVEEIAGVVGMLVGAESGWCTGQVVCANGGMRMVI